MGVDLAVLGERVAPVLLFLLAITVVAELSDLAGVFDEAAHWAARAARGRVLALWLLVVGLAAVSTIVLSLDTTAVLLTPVAITVARQVDVPPLPFAMTTLWLANTASLLLPVSNLTNLLALHVWRQQSGSAGGFLAAMAAPAVVAIVTTIACLWVLHRRELGGRFGMPARPEPHDRVLLLVAGGVCVALGPAFVSGITPAWPAGIAAAALVAVTAWRAPRLLRQVKVPWVAAAGVAVLFVLVDLVVRGPVGAGLVSLVGSGESFAALLRVSGLAALLSNGINNLPAYLALESTVDASPVRLLALLVGVNAGPLVTVWGSLATVLWAQRCRAAGLPVSLPRLALTGLACATVVVTATTAALALAR